MHFLPAVSSAGKTVQQLREEVYEIMQQELLKQPG
jgi:protein involved in polysaccharide export with SLBB domain